MQWMKRSDTPVCDEKSFINHIGGQLSAHVYVGALIDTRPKSDPAQQKLLSLWFAMPLQKGGQATFMDFVILGDFPNAAGCEGSA